MNALLRAERLCFAYDDRVVLDGVSLEIRSGELVGLVGPNGAGKTTLLHCLLGVLSAASGVVQIQGRDSMSLSRIEIARRIALVPQDIPSEFALTVRDVVAMGRTPHLGRFQPEGSRDLKAIERALEATGVDGLSSRLLSELSGGERQRVHIARALAQETAVLMLDEPTANLDVAHQLMLMELVQKLVSQGKATIAALHDLTLAARYCHRILLLAAGRLVAEGPPEEVITERHLAEHFGIDAKVDRDPAGHLYVVPLSANGGGAGGPRVPVVR